MKKLFAALVVAAVMLSSLSTAIAEKNDPTFHPVHPEVQAEAQRIGINTEGLSNIQVKELIIEHYYLEWRNKAEEYGIDINGLTEHEIIYAVQLHESALKADGKAKNGSMDVPLPVPAKTDSDEIIKNLIICPEVQAEAVKRGINCDGLSNLEVKNRISEQIYAENRAKAMEYNLDVSGLSDIQICEKVYQYETEVLSRELKKAEMLANSGNSVIVEIPAPYDTASTSGGLTMGEIEAAGNMDQKHQDIIITAKAMGIEYKELTYDQLMKMIVERKSK